MPGIELRERLGRGAQSDVYRGRRDGCDYAVKIGHVTPGRDVTGATPTTTAEGDRRALVGFRREAALLASARHPALPEIYEVGDVDGRPYLVMELVDGRTLASRLTEGPCAVDALVQIALDVASGLAEAHRHGLVHLDVKPGNILVGADGHATLIDFGLAGHGGVDVGDAVAGTWAYAAPEQTGMLRRPVDRRSDLYGLGVTLYEAAAGVVPFVADDPGEVIRMHAVTAPVALRDHRADLPAGLAAIVARLLAKDPDDRYQTGEGLVADLARVLDEQGPFVPDQAGASAAAWAGLLRVDRSLPFAGRDPELATLRGAWARAAAGELAEVAVHGPMGVGKSRLVGEFLAALPAAVDPSDPDLAVEVPVLAVVCAPGDPVPFAALRNAFAAYLRGSERLAGPGAAVATERLRAAAGPFRHLVGSLSPALARALDVDVVTASDDRDARFAVTFALFLADLARRAQGLVLWIDDAQWIDDASRELLAELTTGDRAAPILLVWSSPAAFPTAPATTTSITLDPLPDEIVHELVAARLHGSVDPVLIAAVATRAAGNPLAVQEYLRAIVDAGVLTPSWGAWQVDPAGLDSLDLPEGIVELVLRRLDHLGVDERDALRIGAAIGSPFDLSLAQRIGGTDAVDRAVAGAVTAGLVELRPGGAVVFVHERVGDALLADLDPDALRGLHQRIAETLDVGDDDGMGAGPDDADRLFAVARHYRLGVTTARPQRRVEVTRRAGRAALARHAYADAHALSADAYAAAPAAGVVIDAGFEHELGTACLLAGRSDEATGHSSRAAQQATDAWDRAAAYSQLAYIDQSEGRFAQAEYNVDAGLHEVGFAAPRRSAVFVCTTVLKAVVSVVVRRLGIGFGTATGEERRRYAIRTTLYRAGCSARYMRGDLLGTVAFAFASVHPANRMGICGDFIRAHAQLNLLGAAVFHRRNATDRGFDNLTRLARASGDPSVMARVAIDEAMGAEYLGRTVEAARLFRRAHDEFGRWMEFGEMQECTGMFVLNLANRGHNREAWQWLAQLERHRGRPDARAEIVRAFKGAIGHTLGGLDVDGATIDEVFAAACREPDKVQRVIVLDLLTHWCYELDRFDTRFDEIVARRDAEAVRMSTASFFQRWYWALRATGRVRQWRAAALDPEIGPRIMGERRLAGRAAARDLRRAVRGSGQPLLRAKALVVGASIQLLQGELVTCLALLREAERLTVEVDAPGVRYDVWCTRARCLLALGWREQADAEAAMAVGLAVRHGWLPRARRASLEFGVSDPFLDEAGERPAAGATVAADRRIGATAVSPSSAGPRLDALVQVSLAAASVIDPHELARIALDEALVILGAERAFLFLTTDAGPLDFYAGRDNARQSLPAAVGYSSTAVDQARSRQQALVVTGSDEGDLIGSTSAVLHGLRSIMVAPLQIEGRLIGVVYLDSRLAKGVFTEADADILVAIATQVAVCFETARSAQLEVLVQSERRQRTLVETLRDVMADLAATFDPDEVLDRLLGGLDRTVPYDAAYVIVPLVGDEPDGATPGGSAPGRVLAALGQVGDADEVRATARHLSRGEPRLDATADAPAPVGGLDLAAGSWLAVPMALGDAVTGLVVVVSATPGAFGTPQLDLAGTVVAHGAVGYQNACLFTNNQRLAVTDDLSGLDNRRRFFELATAKLDGARSDHEALAALMVDIDRFKSVNDTFGHATGDDVIRGVADRLRAVARAGDVVGRYGGEEFALLISATPDVAEVIGERLRKAVAAEPVLTRSGLLHVTVSIGITDMAVTDSGIEELLSRADSGLYEAKAGGRNRVAHC